MHIGVRLFVFIFIIVSNFNCFTSENESNTVARSIDDYLGEGTVDNEQLELLTYNVPTFPELINEQQINNDAWATSTASYPKTGFYREDDDQKSRSAFDFYRPNGNSNKLPLIIFIHCGAFITGKKDDDLIVSSLCRDFTRKGYATANINYRLLINTDNIFSKVVSYGVALVSVEERNNRLFHNSICDIRRATHYFQSHADRYNIDPNNVFLFGYSAGAIAALHAIYLDDSRAATWIHSMNGYGKTETDIPKPNVRGVISVSGGFFRPPNEMWEDREKTPLLLIQGDKDEMVPPGEGKPFQRYIKDYRINSPVLGELKKQESDNHGNAKQTVFTARVGLQVDSTWVNFLRNVFTDDMYGSAIIKQTKSNNCTLVMVKDGLHYFPVDEKTGTFNESYFTMREHALKFIQKNIK